MTQAPENETRRSPDVYAALCPARDVLEVLSGKWAALAIGALEDGPRRFTSLQHRLQGVSPKVLTRTLRRLEDHGFLSRTVIAAVPAHVEYALTDLGRGAAVPLAQLRHWVETHTGTAHPARGATEDVLDDSEDIQARPCRSTDSAQITGEAGRAEGAGGPLS